MFVQSQTAVIAYSGVNVIMRGALPVADPLYSIDATLPAVITDCYVACTTLVNYPSISVKYFRCYSTTLSNNDNYNTINLVANYPNCNSMELFSFHKSPECSVRV